MTRFDIIKMNESLLKVMNKNSINAYDIKYIDIITEYNELCSQKLKKAYILSHLSEKYRLSERNIYVVIKKMLEDIKI